MDNLALAKRAYSWFTPEVKAFERTRDHFQPYFDLLAENVVFKGAWSEDSPVYGGEFRGKSAVMKLVWDDDQDSVSGNDVERPPQYIEIEDDSVAILNQQCYQIKKTGEWVRGIESCTVLTFQEGFITKILCIEDISAWNLTNRGVVA